jgi:hypothetical protein
LKPNAPLRLYLHLLLLLALAAGIPSCAHWRRQWIDPALVVERDHPSELRVWRLDGTHVEIRQPTVFRDSLLASSSASRGSAAGPESSWVPLREIDYVEARRWRTAPGVLSAGLLPPLAVVVAVIVALYLEGGTELSFPRFRLSEALPR